MKQSLHLPPEQVALIETSFLHLVSKRDTLITNFYTRLFNTYPEIEPLFTSADMATQHRKFVKELVTIVETLRDSTSLNVSLTDLGQRHVTEYGVKPEYFDAMKDVLLETMAAEAGDHWTDEYHRAWNDAFDRIANHMLNGD